MSDHSAIEWTDATWNPVTGCTKVSPGCAHCYIERTPPFRMAGRGFLAGSTGVRLHPERLDQPLRWLKPRRVFVCSLADDVPDHFIYDVFQAMHRSPQHTFQVLTKRPERLLAWYRDFRSGFIGGTERFDECWPLPNVWLGVSIENSRFTWRADVLREIPAAVRFISAEPLLGSLYEGRDSRVASEEVRVPALQRGRGGDAALLGRPAAAGDDLGALPRSASDPRAGVPAAPAPVEGEPVRLDLPTAEVGRASLDLTGIDWVIIGGESGPRARPFRLAHAREIIRAARLARQEWSVGDDLVGHTAPAIFVKQLGGAPVDGEIRRGPDGVGYEWSLPFTLRDRKGGDPTEWPADLRIREFPAGRLQAVAS